MDNNISNLSYTNKDFQTIFPELLDYIKTITLKWDPASSNESDPGVVLLKAMSLLADKLNYNIDKNVLECFAQSVTQTKNAWALFSQLGYNMHWYRSSETDVSIIWVGEYTDERITIPRFAQICDSEMSTMFTLTHPVTFYASANRNSVQGHVIEGSIAQVSVNGSTTITLDNLDSKNRIFLTDSNVAENGIFINNVGFENYADWNKVDNLYIQPAAYKCYKVGVDVVSNLVYIQFPDNIVDKISNGIEIHYVRSLGYDGNIKPYLLTQFYESTIDGIDVSTDNVRIINYKASTGGEDVETIEQAYKEYQRTCNLCDTLVTCDDFKNFLSASPLVSNCTVTDRNTDPVQSFTFRCLDTNNQTYYDTFSGSLADAMGGGGKKTLGAKMRSADQAMVYGTTSYEEYGALDPFSIRIVPLKPVVSDDNITADMFNKSFDILAVKKTVHHVENYYVPNNVISYLNNMKHIGITFAPLFVLPFEYFGFPVDLYFQNQFNLDITFVPTYKLSETEIEEVKLKILTTLYRHFNAKEIKFGQEIKYDDVFSIISTCDARIKTLIMAPITYRLFGKTVPNLSEMYEDDESVPYLNNIEASLYNLQSLSTSAIGTRAKIGGSSFAYDIVDIPEVDLILPLTYRYENGGEVIKDGYIKDNSK